MKVPPIIVASVVIVLVIVGGLLVIHKSMTTQLETTPVEVTSCSQTVDSVALNTQRSLTYTCPSTGNSTLTVNLKAKLPLVATVSFVDSANVTSLLYNNTVASLAGNFPTVTNGTFGVEFILPQTTVNKVSGSIALLGQQNEQVQISVPSYPYRAYGAVVLVAALVVLAVAYFDAIRNLAHLRIRPAAPAT